MLTVRGLHKSFGTTYALRGVDLDLAPGVVALLGPNGAGKTTLLRCLATALHFDTGTLAWQGKRYDGNPWRIRATLGYLAQDFNMPGHLTPMRLLHYLARLKDVGGNPTAESQMIKELLLRLGLDSVADRPFATLSGGQVRLAGVAQALLGMPQVLLLDEPTRGLDIDERAAVFQLMRAPFPGRLVLFSTHVPAEVPLVANSLVVLVAGRVVYAGDVATFRQQAQGQVYEISVNSEEAGPKRVIGTPPAGIRAVPVAPTLEDAYILARQNAAI